MRMRTRCTLGLGWHEKWASLHGVVVIPGMIHDLHRISKSYSLVTPCCSLSSSANLLTQSLMTAVVVSPWPPLLRLYPVLLRACKPEHSPTWLRILFLSYWIRSRSVNSPKVTYQLSPILMNPTPLL